MGTQGRLTYQVETLDEAMEDLKPIVESHWMETDADYTDDKLNPDWETYKTLEGAGILRLYTARDGGELVGYCSVIVTNNIHSSGSVVGTTDSIYIDKRYRKSRAGYNLIRFVEKDLSSFCDTYNVSMKAYLPFDDLMLSMGYKLTEKIYTTRLG